MKTDKYIINELKPLSKRGTFRPGHDDREGDEAHLRLLNVDEDLIKGAFFHECVWIWPADKEVVAEPRTHFHAFDELVGFIGSDPQNPHELGGEIEMWLDGEKHTITKSSLIFVPKGMKHCPLVIKRVDRPIFHYAVTKGGVYSMQDA